MAPDDLTVALGDIPVGQSLAASVAVVDFHLAPARASIRIAIFETAPLVYERAGRLSVDRQATDRPTRFALVMTAMLEDPPVSHR